MSETRHKLQEAEYFLHQTQANISDPKAFVFNLSAFLSAARSVTFIMQAEFKKCHAFEAWYDDKKRTKEYGDLKFFNKLRRTTIHQRSIQPSRKAEVEMSVPINPVASMIAKHIIDGNVVSEYKSGPQKSDRLRDIETDVKYSWYFKERPEDDGFKLCRSYVEKLTELVEECEEKFGECLEND